MSGTDDVEVLADVELDPQLVPDVPRLERSGPHQLVRVHECQVADQDRNTFAVSAGLSGPVATMALLMTVCTVGLPRRMGEPSITSSWNSANACSSSSAAPASITSCSSGSPPAPTKPQWQNAGRRRLPPDEHERADRLERVVEIIARATTTGTARHRSGSAAAARPERRCWSNDGGATGTTAVRLTGASSLERAPRRHRRCSCPAQVPSSATTFSICILRCRSALGRAGSAPRPGGPDRRADRRRRCPVRARRGCSSSSARAWAYPSWLPAADRCSIPAAGRVGLRRHVNVPVASLSGVPVWSVSSMPVGTESGNSAALCCSRRRPRSAPCRRRTWS